MECPARAPQADKAWEWFKNIGSPKYHVAPMVDQSELPFRMLCRENGATCAYTPMFHSRLFVQDSKYRKEQWSTCEGDRPLFVQFCANDPEWLVKAALIVAPPAPGTTHGNGEDNFFDNGEEGAEAASNDALGGNSGKDKDSTAEDSKATANAPNGTYKVNVPPPPATPLCDAVDLNLGCPQRIAKRGRYGAFLMDDLPLVESLVKQLVQSVGVAVTVKIRIFPELERTLAYAKMIEAAGASLLAIHGRTREMKDASMHLPDWEQIKAVKAALSIPVLGNGGVRHRGEAEALMAFTGVDGVLSAEPLLVDPALFADRRLSSQGRHSWLEALNIASRYLELAAVHRVHTRMVRGHVHRILSPWLAEYTLVRDKVNVGRNSIEDFAAAVDNLKALVAASNRDTPQPSSREGAEAAKRDEREAARKAAIEEQDREAAALDALADGGGGEANKANVEVEAAADAKNIGEEAKKSVVIEAKNPEGSVSVSASCIEECSAVPLPCCTSSMPVVAAEQQREGAAEANAVGGEEEAEAEEEGGAAKKRGRREEAGEEHV